MRGPCLYMWYNKWCGGAKPAFRGDTKKQHERLVRGADRELISAQDHGWQRSLLTAEPKGWLIRKRNQEPARPCWSHQMAACLLVDEEYGHPSFANYVQYVLCAGNHTERIHFSHCLTLSQFDFWNFYILPELYSLGWRSSGLITYWAVTTCVHDTGTWILLQHCPLLVITTTTTKNTDGG